MFSFTDDERAALTDDITTDAQGREILVGLSFEETAWYMGHLRDSRTGKDDPEDVERYLALHQKHRLAVIGVVVAENQLRIDKPIRH